MKDKWSKTVTDKNTAGDLSLYQIFSNYRKLLKPLVKAAKSSYFCSKIKENKENSKKTWKFINELRGKLKKPLKPSFIIENQRITNRRIIANEFNKYFNSIASTLNETIAGKQINDLRVKTFEDFLMPTNKNTIFLDECTPEEILKIISELENGKSSDVPIRVIKKSAHVISGILGQYFNILMAEGVFPDVLKTGRVTPIFKKGNPEDIGNYRPVSTLPIFGKILEKIIYSRIYNFSLSQNIINQNQFGFRKSHSTSHAVNLSVSIIENLIKNQKHVLGIFIDLSKAFDTIDHQTLLTKLDRYGIRGNANMFIKSYLSNRTQYTDVLDEKSDCLLTHYGVPQGSVLGPLLFLLYINDISRCSELGIFVLFADDTNIFVDGSSAQDAYMKANRLLSSLNTYMHLNKLHINMTKCCYIHFKPRTLTTSKVEATSLHLEIDGFPIKIVEQAKFLGVIIDENLNWAAHIKYLKRKLNYASSTLNRIRDYIPEYLHRDLYYTLFESHLSYCISVWGDAAKLKIADLWTAQKHCARVLFGDKEAFLDKFKTCARTRSFGQQKLTAEFYTREHTKPIFNKNSILSVYNLYTYHCYMETLKILKFHKPISLFEKYSLSSRKPTMLISPLPSRDFIYRSTVIWNIVSPKLKLIDYSIKIGPVKKLVKNALLSMQHQFHSDFWIVTDHDVQKISFKG